MKPNDGNASQRPREERTVALLMNPIVLTALVIVFTTIFLIGANLFGFDKGNVLQNLANSEYARGLITYLFSVGTIGSFVVLILAALIGSGDQNERDERFQKAKEIFSLLIGIFGSIIGYYFGTSTAERGVEASPSVMIAEPISKDSLRSGEALNLTTYVSGGVPPYTYTVRFNGGSSPVSRRQTYGWVRESIATAPVDQDGVVHLQLDIRDAAGDSAMLIQEFVLEKSAIAQLEGE